ncbi:malonate decarboxylase subunit gamma [Legionella beliardensis]|uniref:Malonate decarboxylase subunit gamma n=1 Tax=Legionella beliardensis TaxID=91822 RepID=A0A378I3K5_9GAMM|nr:biotin-independent malonate decarboxylase subunit gamma [Legionella beliardensis]STX29759.1 malonate decarboxylase subunit gamma [Legionella beliardensis]
MINDKITLNELLSSVFSSHQTEVKNNIIFGSGLINNNRYNIIGTIEDTVFGVDESLEMATQVLNLVQQNNHDPIILLADVVGQKLAVRDEWLGMYAYFAHLLKCLHLARKQGNKIMSIIYNQAIGGSFIAFGMMADRIIALKNTELAVMWLEGMAKVTKLDIDMLRSISETSPVFAPGVENFKKLGGIHEVLSLEQVSQYIEQVIKEPSIVIDNRAQLGKQYGGRTMAYDLITAIENL